MTTFNETMPLHFLLNDAEWSGKGSGWIAQQARVSRTLVKDMIQERDASSRRGQIHVIHLRQSRRYTSAVAIPST